MNNKRITISLFCPVLVYTGNAQWTNYNVDLPRMPYLSPEAASLGKYSEITVSEYTGVSQIFSDINKQH